MKKLWNQYSKSEPLFWIGFGAFIIFTMLATIHSMSSMDKERKVNNGHYYTNDTWIYVIDGCEYLKGQNYTHKENCTNSIHKIK